MSILNDRTIRQVHLKYQTMAVTEPGLVYFVWGQYLEYNDRNDSQAVHLKHQAMVVT